VILALSLEYHVFVGTAPVAPLVLLPVSVFLGRRYGRRAVVVVALGGLVLVVGASVPPVLCAHHLDVVLASMLVCALAAAPGGWFDAAVARGHALSLAWLLLLCPWSLGIAHLRLGNVDVSLGFRLECLLYVGLFLVGLARRPALRVLPAVAAAAFAGMLLEMAKLPADARDLLGGPRAELPLLGLTDLYGLWLHNEFDSPTDFLAAAACFLAGGYVARVMRGERALRRSWLLGAGILGLAVLTLGAGIEGAVLGRLELARQAHLSLFGSIYALPLAALLAGMVFGRGGILALALLVSAAWAVEGWIAARGNPEDLEIAVVLHQPANVAGFGVLGLALRDAVLGTRTAWWSVRWTWRTLLVTFCFLLLLKPESGLEVLLAVGVGIVAAVVAGLVARLRLHFLGPTATEHRGWWALAVVFMLVGMVRTLPASIEGALSPRQRAHEAAREASEDDYEESEDFAEGSDGVEQPTNVGGLELFAKGLQDAASDGHCPLGIINDQGHWFTAATVLLLLWSALHVVGQLLAGLPFMAREVLHCAGAVRDLLTGRAAASGGKPASGDSSRVAAVLTGAGAVVRWGRNAILIAGIGLAVALGGYLAHATWHHERKEAEEDDEQWTWPFGVDETSDLAERADDDRYGDHVDEPLSRSLAPVAPATLNQLAEPKAEVNPYLWQATLEAFGDWPIEEQQAARGFLATGWRVDPHDPRDRSRVTCHVGESLATYSLRLELLRERLWLLGLWVERGQYFSEREGRLVGESVYREVMPLEDRIVARAQELAAAEGSSPEREKRDGVR